MIYGYYLTIFYPIKGQLFRKEVTLLQLYEDENYIKYYSAYTKILSCVRIDPKPKFCCVIIYGEAGVGKSNFHRFLPPPWNQPWRCPPFHDLKYFGQSYNQERCVFLDDLDAILEDTKPVKCMFKTMCDENTVTIATKGGSTGWSCDLMIITTNAPMEEWWGGTYESDHALFRRVTFTLECRRRIKPGTPEWDTYYKPKFEKLAEDITSFFS